MACVACLMFPRVGLLMHPYPKICQVKVQISDTFRHNLAFIAYICSVKSRRSNLLLLILAHEDGSTRLLVPGSDCSILEIHMYLNITLRQACRDILATSIPAYLAWSDHTEHKSWALRLMELIQSTILFFFLFVAEAFSPF